MSNLPAVVTQPRTDRELNRQPPVASPTPNLLCHHATQHVRMKRKSVKADLNQNRKLSGPIRRCKNVFTFFLFLSRFLRFLTFFFIFRTFLKIKNVEKLLSMQANSEISALHLTNDRPNCSGLLLLSTFFVSWSTYYMRVGI